MAGKEPIDSAAQQKQARIEVEVKVKVKVKPSLAKARTIGTVSAVWQVTNQSIVLSSESTLKWKSKSKSKPKSKSSCGKQKQEQLGH